MRTTLLVLTALALAIVPLALDDAPLSPVGSASATPSCLVGWQCYAVISYTCEPWMPACPEI